MRLADLARRYAGEVLDRLHELRYPEGDLRQMATTSDRSDPALTRGGDVVPTPMAEKYLVLSEEERAAGFVRPVRRSYIHVGLPGPTYPLRDLTDQERKTFNDGGPGDYAMFEPYPDADPKRGAQGRFWTQEELDSIGKGCGADTTMAPAIAETYARDPHFYGFTYCVGCHMHRPVGARGEFVWLDQQRNPLVGDQRLVGT